MHQKMHPKKIYIRQKWSRPRIGLRLSTLEGFFLSFLHVLATAFFLCLCCFLFLVSPSCVSRPSPSLALDATPIFGRLTGPRSPQYEEPVCLCASVPLCLLEGHPACACSYTRGYYSALRTRYEDTFQRRENQRKPEKLARTTERPKK